MTIAALPRIRVKAVSRRYVPQVIAFAPRVDVGLVELVARFGAMAADGEIDGIAVAATTSDGSIKTAYWTGRSLFTLMAALQAVSARVMMEVEK